MKQHPIPWTWLPTIFLFMMAPLAYAGQPLTTQPSPRGWGGGVPRLPYWRLAAAGRRGRVTAAYNRHRLISKGVKAHHHLISSASDLRTLRVRCIVRMHENREILAILALLPVAVLILLSAYPMAAVYSVGMIGMARARTLGTKYDPTRRFELEDQGVVVAERFGERTGTTIQAAIDYAETYGRSAVFVGPGIWTVTDTIDLVSNVSIVGAGASTRIQADDFGNEVFKGQGEVSINNDFTVDAVRGDITVTVTDGTQFSVGDIIRLHDDNGWEFNQVRSIAVNDLTLRKPIRNGYAVGDAEARVVSAITNVTVANLSIEAANDSDDDYYSGVYFNYAIHCRVQGCWITGWNTNAIEFEWVAECSVSGSYLYNPVGSYDDDECDGVALMYSQDTTVRFNDISDVRRGVSISNETQDCQIVGNVISGIGWVTTEGAGVYINIDYNTRIQIVANTIENSRYRGIQVDADATNISFLGNNISNCKNDGIRIYNSSYIQIVGNQIDGIGGIGVHYLESTHVQVVSNSVTDTSNYGIASVDSTKSLIAQNMIDEVDSSGIAITTLDTGLGYDQHTIENNHVETNATVGGSCIYVCVVTLEPDVRHIKVDGNTCHHAGQYGIYVDRSSGTLTESSITNNLCYMNTRDGIRVEYGDGLFINNNECRDNDGADTATYSGITLSYCTDCEVNYNASTGSTQVYGIVIDANCSSVRLLYNRLVGNTTGPVSDDGYYTISNGNAGYSINQIVEWKQFVDTGSGVGALAGRIVVLNETDTNGLSVTNGQVLGDTRVYGVVYQFSTINDGEYGWILRCGYHPSLKTEVLSQGDPIKHGNTEVGAGCTGAFGSGEVFAIALANQNIGPVQSVAAEVFYPR